MKRAEPSWTRILQARLKQGFGDTHGGCGGALATAEPGAAPGALVAVAAPDAGADTFAANGGAVAGTAGRADS